MALALVLSVASASPGFEIAVGLPHRDPALLESTFWAVSTPGSPRYLQFLTVEEAAALVRPAESTVAAARTWLFAHGATSVRLQPLGDVVVGTFEETPAGWTKNKLPPSDPRCEVRRPSRCVA